MICEMKNGSQHDQMTFENLQWEDLYICMIFFQSQTTIILGGKWCEGFGLRRISIRTHLASSHFQEASPQNFNVQAHWVHAEVI